jgi:hypothetical protein
LSCHQDIYLDVKVIGGGFDRLAARGLVVRAASERDRRARIITLTPVGRARIAKAFGAHKRRMDATAAALTRAERTRLIELRRSSGSGPRRCSKAAPRVALHRGDVSACMGAKLRRLGQEAGLEMAPTA